MSPKKVWITTCNSSSNSHFFLGHLVIVTNNQKLYDSMIVINHCHQPSSLTIHCHHQSLSTFISNLSHQPSSLNITINHCHQLSSSSIVINHHWLLRIAEDIYFRVIQKEEAMLHSPNVILGSVPAVKKRVHWDLSQSHVQEIFGIDPNVKKRGFWDQSQCLVHCTGSLWDCSESLWTEPLGQISEL